MREFDALRSRVEDTAARLAAAQSGRRDRNQSLLDTVARLEAKFAAQEQELTYYRDRIRPLETANAQLSALMSRLLDMVDSGLGDEDDADDPVRAATAKAAAMLEHDLIPLPPQPDMSDELIVVEDTAPMFDDVDGETLAAEAAADAENGDLPSIVQIAAAAAETDADTWAEDVAAEDAEPAEIESVDALADALGEAVTGAGAAQPTAADIRALLERVEAAAAEVRAAGAAAGPKAAPGTDRVTAMPVRRSGGAAA